MIAGCIPIGGALIGWAIGFVLCTWIKMNDRKYSHGDGFWGKAMAARNFKYMRDLKKIGQRADRSEWFMTPQTVNAYYAPFWNEMVFPAAILQPPFFHKAFHPATNFGAIGAIMGHEL